MQIILQVVRPGFVTGAQVRLLFALRKSTFWTKSQQATICNNRDSLRKKWRKPVFSQRALRLKSSLSSCNGKLKFSNTPGELILHAFYQHTATPTRKRGSSSAHGTLTPVHPSLVYSLSVPTNCHLRTMDSLSTGLIWHSRAAILTSQPPWCSHILATICRHSIAVS